MPTLEVTTMVGCPLQCTFCPQDKLTTRYTDSTRSLSLTNFKVMLAKVPHYVRIDFSGMSEPWANRFATDMLEHTLMSGHNVTVYTTLQGMRDYVRVIELLTWHKEQVEALVIHLPDKNGNMRGFKDSHAYQTALLAFDQFRATGVLNHFSMMTMDLEHETIPTVKVEADNLWLPLTRAGSLSLQQIGNQPIEQMPVHSTPLGCGYTPFYDHNVLLPNGDVVLCCMDYSLKHKLGNLLTDNYWDLFRSEGMNKLRVENMQFGLSDSICKNCSRAKTYTVTDEHKQFWR